MRSLNSSKCDWNEYEIPNAINLRHRTDSSDVMRQIEFNSN